IISVKFIKYLLSHIHYLQVSQGHQLTQYLRFHITALHQTHIGVFLQVYPAGHRTPLQYREYSLIIQNNFISQMTYRFDSSRTFQVSHYISESAQFAHNKRDIREQINWYKRLFYRTYDIALIMTHNNFFLEYPFTSHSSIC
ncbi:hypothetical protein ACJX0J_031150, partial [Zea mays]